MMIYHLLSLTIAYFLDLLIGDPPSLATSGKMDRRIDLVF